MDKPLTELADSIAAAHEAVDEIIEFVEDQGGRRSDFKVGVTNDPPELLFSSPQFDEEPTHITCELVDEKAAQYAFRELIDRGFAGSLEELYEDEPTGEHLFVYKKN